MKNIITAIKEHPVTAVLSVLILSTLGVCLYLLANEKIDGKDFAIIFSAVSSALSGIGFALHKYYNT